MTDNTEERPSSTSVPTSVLHSSEDEDEEAEVNVESLITGRAKRSTAGRHMSALIDAAADDDLTLLFEEIEDDNEFEGAEAAEEEDMGMDSSDDDDDDQGPNAQNDYEGEKELQKEERKKRKTQNDLRFQTLRKRVKIDPTAVSSVPAAPRPKKKSERISWLPTVEDGPTRSSSRRQTMVNKELTHARLKDSQEKRIRIIATMKEAEKRKAHLKPKEMTQEDHLAEAERVERLNSKSLNRWEQTEKRKADERRAKIEALQNRRLEGPVISYWSGVATWTNGRLTRVGRVDIKVKPEKDETKKKKKAEEKIIAEPQGSRIATAGTSQPQQAVPAVPEGTLAAPNIGQPNPAQPSDQKPTQDTPKPESDTAPSAVDLAANNKPNEQVPEKETARASVGEEQTSNGNVSVVIFRSSDEDHTSVKEDRQPGASAAEKSSEQIQSEASTTATSEATQVEENRPPSDQAQPPVATGANAKAAAGETTQTSTKPPTPEGQTGESVTHQPAPATTPLESQTLSVPSVDAAPMAGAPVENASQGDQPSSALAPPSQPHAANDASTQPGIPPSPIIEHTGRNLTILENFDDKTAHSKKYSMYFNARKPPRLTSMLPPIV